MSVTPDGSYTLDDHGFRENDPYARAKYDLTLRWIAKAGVQPGATCYNIGVGSGYFNHLATAYGLRVAGCEPDHETFQIAVRSAPKGVDLVEGGIAEFVKGRPPANVVVMHDVLEHIEGHHDAARLLRSVVANDGVAILSVPALMSLFGLHDENLGHYRRYSSETLRAVITPHFQIKRMRWYGMASIPIAWYFSRWRRKPYPIGSVKKSLAGKLYGMICAIEGFIPEPIGTSLIVELRPRA